MVRFEHAEPIAGMGDALTRKDDGEVLRHRLKRGRSRISMDIFNKKTHAARR